jgi:hypothetical protein
MQLPIDPTIIATIRTMRTKPQRMIDLDMEGVGDHPAFDALDAACADVPDADHGWG